MSLEGAVAGDQLGRVLLALPDVDGDGISDFAAGEPFRATASGFGSGAVDVISGANQSLIATLEGTTLGERFGSSLAAGDVTGDGISELIVGSPLYSSGLGGVGAGRISIIDLVTFSVSGALNGDSPGSRFGSAVAVVRGDGTPGQLAKVAVGSPTHFGAAGAQCGRVQVYNGGMGPALFSIEGDQAGDQLGATVAEIGDVNFDFRDDLALGAPFADGVAGLDTGEVKIMTGLGVLIGSFEGTQAGEKFGSAIVGVGDLDGDFRSDFVVGAPLTVVGMLGNAGRIEARSGATLEVLWDRAGATQDGNLGAALVSLGDVTGDTRADVAIGAPRADGPMSLDVGEVVVVNGVDGTPLFTIAGSGALSQSGFTLAALDSNGDGSTEILVGAPFYNGMAGTQTGRVFAVSVDRADSRTVRSYDAGPLPLRLLVRDMDGDGDRDLAVIASGDNTLRILWNGTHTPGDTGVFDTIPATIVPLASGASPTSLTADNLDVDAPLEIFVGRSDGTIEVIDGVGSTATPVFAPFPGLIVADPRPSAGAVTDLAVVFGPGLPQLAVALAGSLTAPGRVVLVQSLLGSPVVQPPLIEGGSFAGLIVSDIAGSGSQDIIATNSSMGSAGGIHVILGPTFSTQNTASIAGIPLASAVGALDTDGVRNDLLIASIGLGVPGATVLKDFQSGIGFVGPLSASSLTSARASGIGRLNQGQVGAAVADGLGYLYLLTQWNGTTFASSSPLLVGSGVVEVFVGPLTQVNDRFGCTRDEIVALVRDEGRLRILLEGTQGFAVNVPGTGCPPTAPTAVIGITGTPVLGDLSFGITLTGATPSSLATLFVQFSVPPGTTPFVIYPSPACGFAFVNPTFYTFDFTTNGSGNVLFPIPLTIDPNLLCLEVLLEWAVLDGGPLGGLTLSDAMILRLGDI